MIVRQAYHEASHAVVGESLHLRVDYVTLEPDPKYPDAVGFTKFEHFVRLDYEPAEAADVHEVNQSVSEESEHEIEPELPSVVDWFFELTPDEQLDHLRKQIIVWKASEAGERLYEADHDLPPGPSVFAGLDRRLTTTALHYIREVLDVDDIAGIDTELTQAADEAVVELAGMVRRVAERIESNGGFLAGDELREVL